MKCTTPEISWHNRDPVLSVDIQNGSYKTFEGEPYWRLATGGADSHVLIWHVSSNKNSGLVKCMADLERHQRAVNVVRFSPSKEILASGDDESIIILWKRKEDCDFFIPSEENDGKEQWTSWKVLKGHLEDVYDISWSPDSNFMVSGSVDNTAILWDIHKGRSNGILTDFKGFVQGVSWDPCNQYICTISTDRQCRLIDISTKKTIQRVYKSKIPTPPDHPLQGKVVRLFYDDTFKSFFRRLTFSIDGRLIIVPSGIIEPQDSVQKISNATIVFSRYNLKEPIMILPSLDECTIAVRCCPVYFKLRENGPTPMIALPYRIVFGVATQRSVLIYDTQQISPVAMISNIHYTRLTDITWSSDGHMLVVSSTDGYCTIIQFKENELGSVYEGADVNVKPVLLPANVNNKESSTNANSKTEITNNSLLTVDIDNNAMDVDVVESKTLNINNCSKRLNIEDKEISMKKTVIQDSEQAQEKVKGTDNEIVEETEDIKLIYSEENSKDHVRENANQKTTPEKVKNSLVVSNKIPRRVQLITLSSPKKKKQV